MSDFRIGDLVWAKMKGFPAWPARVSEPRKAPKKLHSFVYFFGTKDFAWIPDEQISHHSDAMLATIANRKMTATLKAAVQEITEEASKDGWQRRATPENDDVAPQVVRRTQPSIKTKLALKYKKLKDSKKHLKAPRKRFFGGPRRPKAVISPYDDDPAEDAAPSVTHVPPTDKRIGFLGLGAMGQCIVRNLLKSGHKVTVWDLTSDKCDAFVRCGALKAATPADVVAACDLTFCCVSDPYASKVVVFSPNGVLRGLEAGKGGDPKGYVEMTSLDDQTSQEISEAVQFENGRYLEAQMAASTRQLAQDGDLTVLGAGDISLFRECETVFHAISKHAYYVSSEVGIASNLSIASSALCGAVCAAIGEALALADRVGVTKKDFLDVAKMVGFGCPLVDEKLVVDPKRRPPPTISVKNQQKDLHLAMQLSDTKSLPMPVVAAANELYKHAKRLGYKGRDSSAIYMATKF